MADDVEPANKDHRLGDVGLNLVELMSLGAAWSCGTVGGHRPCLTTNGDQYAPVGEDADGEYDDVERHEVPDYEAHKQIFTHVPKIVTHAIFQSACFEQQWCQEYNLEEPSECHGRVYHPTAQLLSCPDMMDHLQIAFDGEGGDVDSGTKESVRNRDFTLQRQAQPVAQRARVADIAKLHRRTDDQKKSWRKDQEHSG